ncbi:hypothetical protein IGI04_033725 [Brassica rapa subsp. trilocularis]|uniref:Uncharacterized protein n=1 Tax=Brassica rapa subsp. trilocularis TaxID=1813537 RepID=A0ABQ7L9F7_BRACM|nr:hypothetical protein IGI04_033725 [Brassica rapa subsp. trilocularis]
MDLCTDSPDASIPIQGPSFMPRRLQFVNSSSAFMSLAKELLIVHNNNFDIGVRSVPFLLWWNHLEPVATVSCFGASGLKPELSKFPPGEDYKRRKKVF